MISVEDKKNRIMDYALNKFMVLGITRVTMDDIARGVGMGKGTVYKLFPSKEALLLSSVDFLALRIEAAFNRILTDEKTTPVDKLTLFIKAIAEKLSVINPEILNYLERSMPDVYEKIEKTRQRMIMTNFVKLMKDGKNKGIFDSQMDEILVAHIIIGAMSHTLDARVFETLNYTLDQLFHTITSILLKGCLTEEGRKQFSKTL